MWVFIISLLEALYLSYTFHFLKTSVDFNILDSPQTLFFKHATGNAKVYRICPFGQYAIWVLIVLLILRCYVEIPQQYILAAVTLALIISLVNLNAFVYLIPVVLIESYQFLAHMTSRALNLPPLGESSD